MHGNAAAILKSCAFHSCYWETQLVHSQWEACCRNHW